MPMVYIDEEVYRWLQAQALGFEKPNAALRRIAGLSKKMKQRSWHDVHPEVVPDASEPERRT